MADRDRGRGRRPSRRTAFRLEGLDRRELLSLAGLGPALGPYVAPGRTPRAAPGRPAHPPRAVDVHRAVNQALQGPLGPGFDRVAREAEQGHPAAPDALSTRVLAQPFVHGVLADNDTYQLLNSAGVTSLLAPQTLQANAQGIVTLTLPASDLASPGDPSLIIVHPGDPAPGGGTFASGFQVEVPAVSVLLNNNQTITVQVPLAQVPTQAQTTSLNLGLLGTLYPATGPLVVAALTSGQPAANPTASPNVPGLRLVDALQRNRNFSVPALSIMTRILHSVAQQNLLNPNATQVGLINQGLTNFLTVVDSWGTSAAGQAAQLLNGRTPGQLVPTLTRGPLGQTLEVSFGTVQPGGPNMPERVDIGFIVDRFGNYGLVLTARGPLSNTFPATNPNGIVAGDLQVEVSNAPTLTALNGWRVVEGITSASLESGALAATNQGGVATFAASAGYGAGLEYGLGLRYTQVIPLGNISQ